jgi:CubicO group peptidase (beta-lactamase class C family)
MTVCLVRWCAISLCLISGAALASELPVAKPEDAGMSSEKLAKVDVVMDDLVKEKKLAGAVVMIARHGKVVHLKSHGLMDIESGKAMRDDAIFRIYSMTKAITTTAALILVDEGKLGLDDPVEKYLPELKDCMVQGKDGPFKPSSKMTIRDLMLHTAGFTYGNSGNVESDKKYREENVIDFNSTLAEMTMKLSRVPLVYEPGTDWQYSVSIDVLGRVVEVVSGASLDEFFQARIFMPLDMKDTGFHLPADKLDRFTTNYNTDGNGSLTVRDAPAASEYLKRRKLLSGGGGLLSTARDYMRFLMMISRGGQLDGVRILSEKTVKLMTSNQLGEKVGWIKFGGIAREGVGFGLGFSIRSKMSIWDPQGRVGEYGWGGAASTHYWTSPKDDLIVITLEQTMPYSFLTEFAVKGLIYDSISGQ